MNKKQKYITRQVMSSNSYEIFHYKDVYLNEISLHHHDFYEVYLFLSGSVRYFIEGKIYKLTPGDIVIISSNELHQPIFEDNSKPYERIVLWLNKDFVKALSTENSNLSACFENTDKRERNNVLKGSIEMQQNLKLIFTKLLGVTEAQGYGSDLYYKIFVSEILLNINQWYQDMNTVNKHAGIGDISHEKERLSGNNDKSHNTRMGVDIKNSALIQSLLAYIEEHIEEEISLDELSERFFLSKFYLSRVFKKQTGTTIHRYIVKKKLIAAKELIHEGIPAVEVYKRAGFGDYCNFLKAFKAEYGTTPTNWVQDIKRNKFT